MNNTLLKKFILISFLSIILSRLLPHPPNFTSTIAVAFYLPALFGAKFLIVALSAFIISDLILGLHSLVFFTWGSLFLIAYLAKYFQKFYFRIFGVSLSCIIFSSFKLWCLGFKRSVYKKFRRANLMLHYGYSIFTK